MLEGNVTHRERLTCSLFSSHLLAPISLDIGIDPFSLRSRGFGKQSVYMDDDSIVGQDHLVEATDRGQNCDQIEDTILKASVAARDSVCVTPRPVAEALVSPE